MSHPILERHIKARAIRPLYLFYGEEDFLLQRTLRRLEKALAAEAGEPPLKVLKEAQEVGLPEFLALSREAPLWGSGQLLVLRRVNSYAAEALQAVDSYLGRPAPRTWVVLVAEGLKARDLAKTPVWARLQREGAALGFFRLREGELYQWLAREAENLGKNLTLAAGQRLVEIVGDNLSELSQELEKLTLYAGPEKTLTPALVSQLASHSRTYNIFALVDALAEPGAPKKLAALDRLLDLGEAPPRILVMLARQIRDLLRLKESEAGSLPELARNLNLSQWKVKKLAQQAALFSAERLRSHLLVLHQTDFRLKTSAANPQLLLEWTVLQLGPGGRRG